MVQPRVGYTAYQRYERDQLSLTHQGRYSFGTWQTSLTHSKSNNLGRSLPLTLDERAGLQTLWNDVCRRTGAANNCAAGRNNALGALNASEQARLQAFLPRPLRTMELEGYVLDTMLDLDFGESSVIGDRAFARDPRVVTVLAQALMLGLQQSGMGNCGKHFPGHGFVKADSHLAIPVDKRSLKAILAEDAAPYGWLSSGLQAVMPAHVIYPKVDGRPAGFSQRWLQDVLRHQLGFTGAIFSDDLSMEGARRLDGQVVSYTDAGIAALEAGCDLVLLCNQSLGEGQAVDELIDGLAKAQAQGLWQPSVDSESRRLALLPETLPQPWDELMLQPAYMQALDLLM